jgi:hypothetical protein
MRSAYNQCNSRFKKVAITRRGFSVTGSFCSDSFKEGTMSNNKDLEDRINELERAKLQKRIAELEAEQGAKPNVKEEPVGRAPGQESWKATPITKKTLKQNKVYQLGETLFLLLPVFVFGFYFLKGGITLWGISAENIYESFRDIYLYIAGGFIVYLIFMELIWNLIVHIILVRMEGGTRIRGNQGIKPVEPVARSAIKGVYFLIPAVLIISVAFVLFGKPLFTKINFTGSTLGSGPTGVHLWKGAYPFTLTYSSNLGWTKWTGIPWMILEQDKVSLKITSVVFGISETTLKLPGGVPLPEGWERNCLPQGSRTPDMVKLELQGCIMTLASSVVVENGVQQFSFTNPTGDVGFVFNYTSDQMEGTASILDGHIPELGYSTEPNAIKLYRLK